MAIGMIRKKRNECFSDEGGTVTVSLVYPEFSEEIEGHRALNAFYGTLIDRIVATARAETCTVIGELPMMYADRDGFSLYWDLLYYRGRVVVGFCRLSDNRFWDGLLRPLPKILKRVKGRWDGWYDDGTKYVLFRNPAELPGLVRRSDCWRYLAVQEIGYR